MFNTWYTLSHKLNKMIESLPNSTSILIYFSPFKSIFQNQALSTLPQQWSQICTWYHPFVPTANDRFASRRYAYLSVTFKKDKFQRQKEILGQSYVYNLSTLKLRLQHFILNAKECCALFILLDSCITKAIETKALNISKKKCCIASFLCHAVL